MNSKDTPLVSPNALEAFVGAHRAVVQEAGRRLYQYGRDVAHWSSQTTCGIATGIGLIVWSLTGAMHLQEPALLDDQIAWVNRWLVRCGIAPEGMLRSLQLFAEVVEMVLPPEHSLALHPYIEHMVAQQEASLGNLRRLNGGLYGPPVRPSSRSKHSWLN